MFFGGIGEEATRQAIAGAGLLLNTLEVVDEGGGPHCPPYLNHGQEAGRRVGADLCASHVAGTER